MQILTNSRQNYMSFVDMLFQVVFMWKESLYLGSLFKTNAALMLCVLSILLFGHFIDLDKKHNKNELCSIITKIFLLVLKIQGNNWCVDNRMVESNTHSIIDTQ